MHPYTLALLACALLASVAQGAKTEQYIVTIDAGSSGSRVHVHKVSVPTKAQPVPKLLSAVNEKIKPGLSSFADRISSVDEEHIRGLVKFAYDNVPADVWKETPIYLKATAGMRSIPQEKADRIMAVVRAGFSGTAFIFEPEWASVISGIDEAKFGWIATNYLNDRFSKGKDLLGVLEMGGASMQMSYAVPKTVPADNKKVLEIQLGAETYHLFAHSFLGFGLEQAQELMAKAKPDQVSACYPPGHSYSIKTMDNIVGAGNYDQCYQQMDAVLDLSSCPTSSSGTSRCSIEGTMLPYWDENKIDFVAIENFWYSTEFMTQGSNKLGDLKEKGRAYCAENWDELKSKYLTEREDEAALQKYCFSSAYMVALLDHGLGIPMMEHTEVAHSAGGTDIDWAVGSVVHDALKLHHSHNGGHFKFSRSRGSEGSSSMGTGAWLALGFMFLFIVTVAKRNRRKNYQDHL